MSNGSNSTDERSTGRRVSPLATEVCRDLTLAHPDMAEVYRYLGYSGEAVPMPRNAQRIAQLVAETLPCFSPRGTFSLYAVTGWTTGSLGLGDFTISGNIGEFLAHADRVAVFVVTVGGAISRLAENASRDGDVLAAWTMDALGSWAAEAAADALMGQMRPHLRNGEGLTLRYSPGYCGMDIGQQRTLFQMVQAGSVGVDLLPSMLMSPLKSISGIVGLGPSETISSHRSACDRCPQVDCHMRR